ncbi:MAG TPA: hydroxyacid dehydrogenase [Opitutaceae bacterium]|nr:hydroxyacid dehydrogenase [Opitutaceae bacterium]
MTYRPADNPASSLHLSPEPRIVVALTARERKLFFADRASAFSQSWRVLEDAQLRPETWSELLRELQPEILLTGWSTPPLPEAWIAQADCRLRYVCHVTGSVRRLVPRGFIERGGLVTNWGETVSAQVAEHALLLALGALRSAAIWPSFIARPPEARRIEELGTRSLFGLRVGLHGFGSVARALLPLLAPFNVSLSAFSAGVAPEAMRSLGVTACASLEELFGESDVLIECEALTPATQGVVSAALLARLPNDAVFVNVGRGGLVDDEALLRETRSGRLRVALDVANGEPLTPESDLAQTRQIFLSPHIGGPTLDRYAACGSIALDNLRSVLQGHRPRSAIDLVAYDRAT